MVTRNLLGASSSVTEPVAITCCACHRPAPEPRRGLCFACYLRIHRPRPLGRACDACGLEDRRVLRRTELAEGPVTLCANHAAIASERMMTLRMLREELFPPGERRQRDRRNSADRRKQPRGA